MNSTEGPHQVDPYEFEILTRNLLESLLLCERVSPIEIFHRRRYPGKRSGHQHEIDLSFTASVAGTTVLVLIECKAYRRPVPVSDVLTFAERLDDIGAHKGIMVALEGFDPGALRIAKGRGIALAIADTRALTLDLIERCMPDPEEIERLYRTIEAMATVLGLSTELLAREFGNLWQRLIDDFIETREERRPSSKLPLRSFTPVEGCERLDALRFSVLLVSASMQVARGFG